MLTMTCAVPDGMVTRVSCQTTVLPSSSATHAVPRILKSRSAMMIPGVLPTVRSLTTRTVPAVTSMFAALHPAALDV